MAFVPPNLPPPQAAFVQQPSLALSYTGYQYLLSLLAATASEQPTATLATDLTATGATQATALPLAAEWNDFSTVDSGTGALLQVLQPGQAVQVYNGGTNTLAVYPPPNYQTDSAAVNVAYDLAAGDTQVFQFRAAPAGATPGLIRTQL